MNQIFIRTISIMIALALTLGTFTSGQADSSKSESVHIFVAEADSQVQEANPETNYGESETMLYVEGGDNPDIESYLKFNITGISGTITSAKLRVYVVEGTSDGPSLYATKHKWKEKGIRWNNRPERTSDALDNKGELVIDNWAEYDVTAYIAGDGTYSFSLVTDSLDGMAFSSREGSFPPELVVSLAEVEEPTATVILPTSTPTITLETTATSDTVVPTVTAILPTPTSTPVSIEPEQFSIQPEVEMNLENTMSMSLALPSISMLISSTEILKLPTSGTAWDKLRTTAYGSWGTADLKNQDHRHAILTLAGALVYARTGDTALRSKVKSAIITAKRSLDQSSEWQTTNAVLATGRQLATYVIAAELINLKSYDSAADQEFRSWLTTIRTKDIGTHGRWKALTYTCENGAGNWNTFACASRIAASIYLGDTADVDRAANIIRAFFGERSYYPSNAPGKNGYFEHTAGYLSSWACVDSSWKAINPPCTKSGINIDGVLLEDASRGGGCCVLKGDGIMYSWEALQGLFLSTELLYRTGRYGNPYDWSNKALKRSLDFMKRSGWGISNVAKFVPWLANKRYGTSYSTAINTTGRIMSWGDWLFK